MEQRLAALFASVGNALDSSTYTYSDSDYLVRKALVKFLDGENALVASARKIEDSTEAVDAVLNYVISTNFNVEDPATWYRDAMRIVVEFSDFAFRNEMSEDSARYAALLPEGHPRVLRVTSLTASAQRHALAEWMSADPRLDDESSAQVYRLYTLSEDSDDVEAEFETLKAEALVAAGRMPEDLLPIVAAFNLSFAQRSAISKALAAVRRRDRKGRFANEFGRLKLFFKSGGGFFSEAPRIVGPGKGDNSYNVEFGDGGKIPKGVYEVDASLGENIKAYLPKKALKGIKGKPEVVAEADKKYAIDVDNFVKGKKDAPDNWDKSGKGFKSKDGKFTANPIKASEAQKFLDKAQERGDETIISGTGAGDAFDPENPEAFLITDNKGRTKGVAQDWAGIQEISIANGMVFDRIQPSITEEGFRDFGPELDGPGPYPLGWRLDGPFIPGIAPGSRKQPELPKTRVATPEELAEIRKKPLESLTDQELYDLLLDSSNKRLSGDKERAEYEKAMGEVARRNRLANKADTQDVDLNQDIPTSKESLSPDLIGEGYNFSKDSENSWRKEDHGENGESYVVTKSKDGKWVVSEEGGTAPDNLTDKNLQEFDNALEAFEYANDRGTNPSEFDQDWVDELLSDQSADLNQGVAPSARVDRNKLSPEMAEEYSAQLDDMDSAISDNDSKKINSLLEKAALDRNLPDEVYASLYSAKEARGVRAMAVENALDGGSKEDIEDMLNDPDFAGWKDRLQSALTEDVDLNQDAPILSEKQSEPATGKQYAFLKEFLDEKNLDPATEQAFRDAIEEKNLNKAQASSLIAIGRGADFRDGVDQTKPSERMLNSLQGYLATKDLTPTEIKDALDSLENDGSRDNVDALLNKLRRKKDKPVDLNQGTGSMISYGDGNYDWEDDYNSVSVSKDPNGWSVHYTNPDPQDRGGQNWDERDFKSEAEALAFAEELIRENQDDGGYARAEDRTRGFADLDQDAKGTLADPATDKQWDFLKSLLDGKNITNPELESAVRSAINDRNLTKGEVGAFIGQLRPLGDKPNVRREPSAKQIASIQRGVLERGLSPEERKSLQDRLDAGLSFDEASEILNDLKSREITPQGMSDLLDKLSSDQDFDSLEYLLSKPEYSDYDADIKDTMRSLAMDTQDPRFQQAIDAREANDIDLNQDAASNIKFNEVYPNNTSQYLERALEDKLKRLEEEGAPEEEILEVRSLAYRMRAKRLERPQWGSRRPSEVIEFSPEEADLALDSLNEYLSDPENNLNALGGVGVEKARKEKAAEDLMAKLDSISRGEKPPQYKRPPTEKQIASIRRGALERGLSEDEAASILDNIQDISFDDASKIISDLKARPITDEGMDNLVNNSELDVLESIVDRPDYAPWKEKIQSKIDEIGSEPDLNQDLPTGEPKGPRNTTGTPEEQAARDLASWFDTPDEIAEIIKNGNLGTLSPEDAAAEVYGDDGQDSDWNSRYNAAYKDMADRALNDPEFVRHLKEGPDAYTRDGDFEADAAFLLAKAAREDGPDLNQDAGRFISRDDFSDKIADDIDALDKSFIISGDELQSYLDEFDGTDSPQMAADVVANVYDMSKYTDDPDLKQRIRDLAARLDEEAADRFGITQAARRDGDDFFDLDSASEAVDLERELYFETDPDNIADKLDNDGYYGDNRSGGAEARVSENEDGTYTATVGYDRENEEQTFEDRDEAIAWAASRVSDYNFDNRPTEYGDSIDLEKEAEAAKTDEQAAAFADRLDALADDLENNRGDERVARSLREYGERIRDMVAERNARNESGVPDDVTTPETMEEMATDPDLNPAGYADAVNDDLFKKLSDNLEAGPSERIKLGEYLSDDGRVMVRVESDADDGVDTSYFDVIIDGETVRSGIALSEPDGVSAQAAQIVEDHFSKKA